MGKIGLYVDHYLSKIGLFSDYFIRESGILLFIVIILGMILMVVFVWQKIRIKKVHADFLRRRALED